MTDHSTPELSIRRELERTRFDTGVGIGDLSERIIVQLELDGYVIVHPDDYPRAEYGNVMNTTEIGFAAGVNVCLDRIFNTEQEAL